MRRKPVTRSEIRLTGWYITTLPVDAVRRNDVGDLAPIRKLWEPLLREVNRASKRDYGKRSSYRRRPWRPTDLPRLLQPWPYTCQRCGRAFYRVYGGSSKYCSDVCVETARREQRAGYNAAMVEARSEARAAARADRRTRVRRGALLPPFAPVGWRRWPASRATSHGKTGWSSAKP